MPPQQPASQPASHMSKVRQQGDWRREESSIFILIPLKTPISACYSTFCNPLRSLQRRRNCPPRNILWLEATFYWWSTTSELYTREMFGVKVNVTWTKPTNLKIRHASFDPFPILPLKEMVSDPVLKITVSLPLKGFSGGRIGYKVKRRWRGRGWEERRGRARRGR